MLVPHTPQRALDATFSHVHAEQLHLPPLASEPAGRPLAEAGVGVGAAVLRPFCEAAAAGVLVRDEAVDGGAATPLGVRCWEGAGGVTAAEGFFEVLL